MWGGFGIFENSGIYRAEMAEKSPGKGKGFFMGRVFTDTSPLTGWKNLLISIFSRIAEILESTLEFLAV